MSGVMPCPWGHDDAKVRLERDLNKNAAWVACNTCWCRGPWCGWNKDEDAVKTEAIRRWNDRNKE
jgi:hypothetical protein